MSKAKAGFTAIAALAGAFIVNDIPPALWGGLKGFFGTVAHPGKSQKGEWPSDIMSNTASGAINQAREWNNDEVKGIQKTIQKVSDYEVK